MSSRKMVGGIFFCVVVYALFALWGDAPRLWAALQSFEPLHGVGALGLVVVGYGLRLLKWQYYLRKLDVRVPWGMSSVVFFAGMVMSITPGKVGEVLKSVLLERAVGVGPARTAPVVLMERVTDLLGLCVIAAFGVGVFGQGLWPLLICAGLMVAGLVVLSRRRLIFAMLDVMVPWPGVGRVVPTLREAYGSVERLMSPGVLGVTTLLSVGAWGLEGVAFYVIIEGLGGKPWALAEAMFIFAMTTILGALSFLPGGVGVTEGGMVGLLVLLDVFEQESRALAATYLIRLATLWFGVGVGASAWAYFKWKWPGSRVESSEGK